MRDKKKAVRYKKERKDASRRRIVEAATERFRRNGIAASGLAGIMSDAGLTNGAFYSHFRSKAELVRECVAVSMENQARQLREIAAARGLEGIITVYLSAEHRDNPGKGCPSAALLPEIAREPFETRRLYEEHLLEVVRQMSMAVPPQIRDSEASALGLFAALVGTLQLARSVKASEASDRILAAGAQAARALVLSQPDRY
jgi:AcrR family transcriptional regulator